MTYFYVTIRNKTLEVVVLGSDVLRMKLHLQGNFKYDSSLIVSIKGYMRYWIFENTTQYYRGVSLKFEYEINLRHKSHKR